MNRDVIGRKYPSLPVQRSCPPFAIGACHWNHVAGVEGQVARFRAGERVRSNIIWKKTSSETQLFLMMHSINVMRRLTRVVRMRNISSIPRKETYSFLRWLQSAGLGLSSLRRGSSSAKRACCWGLLASWNSTPSRRISGTTRTES